LKDSEAQNLFPGTSVLFFETGGSRSNLLRSEFLTEMSVFLRTSPAWDGCRCSEVRGERRIHLSSGFARLLASHRNVPGTFRLRAGHPEHGSSFTFFRPIIGRTAK
jgi:hypothetical protein